MTDDPTTNDSIEPRERDAARRADGGGEATSPEPGQDRPADSGQDRPADSGHDSTAVPGGDSVGAQGDDGLLGGRSLLAGAAGAVLGVLGLGAASGSASAAGGGNRLLVVGDGKGRHDYEIEMESGGTIRKASHAGSTDSIGSTAGGGQRVEGEVWHCSLDSYRYSGEIDAVTADGSVAFHFLDGAFTAQGTLDIRGRGSGRHLYEIGSNSADLELDSWSTEYVDSDDGPAPTEQWYTPDRVSGALRGTNHDSYGFGYYEPIQQISVQDGHLRFS